MQQVEMKNTILVKASNESADGISTPNQLNPDNAKSVELNQQFNKLISNYGLDYVGPEAESSNSILSSPSNVEKISEEIHPDLLNQDNGTDLFLGGRNGNNALLTILNGSTSTQKFDQAADVAELKDLKLLQKLLPELNINQDVIKLNGQEISKTDLIKHLKIKEIDLPQNLDLQKIIKNIEQSIPLENKLISDRSLNSQGHLKLLKTQDFLAQKESLQSNIVDINSKTSQRHFEINAFSKNQQPFEGLVVKSKESAENNLFDSKNNGNDVISAFNIENNDLDHVKTKEFKMTSLSEINSSDREKLIKNVTNYIEKNNLKLENGVELTVQDNQIGKFKIQATNQNGETSLKITSMSSEGHEFFTQNRQALEIALKDSGLKVTDLKIMMSSDKIVSGGTSAHSSGFNFEGGNNSNHGSPFSGNGQNGQFRGDEGSQKRQQLWNQYKEQFNKYAS